MPKACMAWRRGIHICVCTIQSYRERAGARERPQLTAEQQEVLSPEEWQSQPSSGLCDGLTSAVLRGARDLGKEGQIAPKHRLGPACPCTAKPTGFSPSSLEQSWDYLKRLLKCSDPTLRSKVNDWPHFRHLHFLKCLSSHFLPICPLKNFHRTMWLLFILQLQSGRGEVKFISTAVLWESVLSLCQL